MIPNNKNKTDLKKQLIAMAKERKAKKITTANLVYLLSDLAMGSYTKGFVIMASEPSNMRKTNNPFIGRVKKFTGWAFDLNCDYTRKVNLQREREGMDMDFEALPTYAEPINKIVYRHKVQTEKLYMSVFPTSNIGQFTKWMVDGREATNEEIEQIQSFIPDKSNSSRQGTEKKVEIRRPLLSNIFLISIAGQRYSIIDNLLQLDEEKA